MSGPATRDVSSLFPRRNVRPLLAGDPKAIGRYALVGRLPSGGMGADVFIARGPPGEVFVVVKALLPDQGPELVRRFTAEAENAARVSSTRVAAVLDTDLGAARPYYVQAYVDGTPLSELLGHRGTGLPPEELRGLAIGLLLAIMDVHAARVAHRDIKPGNIIVTPDGEVVLVDFGISRETDDSGTFPPTESWATVLTMRFAAPEQMRPTRELTRAVDVYAWGMVVAYASLGHHPVDPRKEMSPGEYLLALQRREVDLQALPPDMEGVVREALAPRPKDRPAPGLLLRRVESATRWLPLPDEPPTKELTLVQPRWSVADVRSMTAAVSWGRYWLSAVERSVVDEPSVYRWLLVLAVIVGGVLGHLLGRLYLAF
jgi:serine/threonine protein kinase